MILFAGFRTVYEALVVSLTSTVGTDMRQDVELTSIEYSYSQMRRANFTSCCDPFVQYKSATQRSRKMFTKAGLKKNCMNVFRLLAS